MAASYQTVENGRKVIKLAASAGGTANAGLIPALDANGKLTLDMLPTGIAPDVDTLTASEALVAGAWVNVNPANGQVRNASASSINLQAHGYVLATVAANAQAAVYFDDNNTGVTGATIGTQWLSVTPGQSTTTPPTGAGVICQILGVAVSATTIHAGIQEPVILAQ